jgi:hypothetical protein
MNLEFITFMQFRLFSQISLELVIRTPRNLLIFILKGPKIWPALVSEDNIKKKKTLPFYFG